MRRGAKGYKVRGDSAGRCAWGEVRQSARPAAPHCCRSAAGQAPPPSLPQTEHTTTFDPAFAGGPAPWGTADDYFYADKAHPSDRGHQLLADLIIGMLQRAAAVQVAASGQPKGRTDNGDAAAAVLAAGIYQAAAAVEQGRRALPPPMQSGVVDAPTSLCLMQVRLGASQADSYPHHARTNCLRLGWHSVCAHAPPTPPQEDFKGAVAASLGWEFKPMRPNATSFVGQVRKWEACRGHGASCPHGDLPVPAWAWGFLAISLSPLPSDHAPRLTCLAPLQKWGWTAAAVGAWAELLVDTRENRAVTGSNAVATGCNATMAGSNTTAPPSRETTIYLGHYRSWKDMVRGRAWGCGCC